MAWIKVEDDVLTHYKTRNLRRILNLETMRDAGGYVLSLLIFAFKAAWRDGNLAPYGDDVIEEACEWRGKPGDLVRAFRECGKIEADGNRESGYLDGSVVHNWVDRAGKLIHNRMIAEDRRKGKKFEPPSATAQRIIDQWNAYAKTRGLAAALRVNEAHLQDFSPEAFALLLKEAGAAPFLHGTGEHGWRMSLAWLLDPANREKVLTGVYRKSAAPANGVSDKAAGVDDDYRETTKRILARRKAQA